MITPLDIPACALWLDGADPSTMYQSISVSRENLILYPESFNQWTILNGGGGSNFSVTGILTSNHVPPDNSTLITNRISISADSAFDTTLQYNVGPLALSVYTYSVWFKPLTLSAVRLDLTRSTTSVPGIQGASCVFDLQTGTISGSVINYGGVAFSTATITPSAGWYECTLTISNSATQNYYAQIKPLSAGALLAYGAQVELSATRTGYFVGATVAPILSSAITTNLSSVGCWVDKSSRQQIYSNKWRSDRPVYIPSLSAVRFTGQYLATSSVESLSAQTVFIFGRVFNGNNSLLFTQGVTYPTLNYYSIQPEYIYHSPFYHGGGWGNKMSSMLSNGYPNGWGLSEITTDGTYQIYNATRSGNVIRNSLNGISPGSASPNFNVQFIKTNCRALASGIQDNQSADVCEVIVYNRELTPAEKAEVEYYLIRKWKPLNSTIPRYTYAVKNGLWSDPTVWSINAEPSPWNVLLSSDTVYSNTFTITADSSTRVSTIQNAAVSPNIAAGGFFALTNGVSLSCISNIPLASYTSTLLTLTPGSTAMFTGNVNGSTTANSNPVVRVPSNTTLTIYGNIYNGTAGNNTAGTVANSGIVNVFGNVDSINGVQQSNLNNVIFVNSGTANIVGNVRGTNYGNDATKGVIICNSTSVTNITGNITSTYIGYSCSTILTYDNSVLNIVGNIFYDPTFRNDSQADGGIINFHNYGNSGTMRFNILGNVGGLAFASDYNPAIVNIIANVRGNIVADTGSGYRPCFTINNGNTSLVLSLTGDIIASVSNNAIVNKSTRGTSLSVIGNIINAPNGRQAIYAPRYQVFPSASATYTRHAVNGYDSYVYYWTPDATFSYPASTDVRLGQTYRNNALTGTMIVPSPSSVFLNCPVDTSTNTIFQVVSGGRYQITSNPLNTNFMLIGAENNNTGTIFVATSTLSMNTPLTAYNDGTGTIVTLGQLIPNTSVDLFWNRALTAIPSPTRSAGDILKRIVTTDQLSSVYRGLVYGTPGSF